MQRTNLSPKELKILNSKIGLKHLFTNEEIDLDKTIRNTNIENQLRKLQAKLVDLQNWIINEEKKIVILFEGRDAAGKGGAIRRITAHINPRYYRIIALPKPSSEERGQWYFQRYVNRLPTPGEIVFFDRSWYNRAVVEPVNGFCTEKEYNTFMGQVNEFERMIVESDTYLIKLYFSISKEEQANRFEDIRKNPLKRWKMSPVDEKAQELWDQYTSYKTKMFDQTNTDYAPWKIIKADKKQKARLEALSYLLDSIPYEK
jgi:polyphosphate kinase 2